MAGNYTEIELDKPRRLRFEYNDICDVEEKAGFGVPAMFSQERIGFRAWQLLLWGGLKWADRKLTVQEAGKLIGNYIKHGGSLEDIIEKLKDALVISGFFNLESEEEDEEGNPIPEEES